MRLESVNSLHAQPMALTRAPCGSQSTCSTPTSPRPTTTSPVRSAITPTTHHTHPVSCPCAHARLSLSCADDRSKNLCAQQLGCTTPTHTLTVPVVFHAGGRSGTSRRPCATRSCCKLPRLKPSTPKRAHAHRHTHHHTLPRPTIPGTALPRKNRWASTVRSCASNPAPGAVPPCQGDSLTARSLCALCRGCGRM